MEKMCNSHFNMISLVGALLFLSILVGATPVESSLHPSRNCTVDKYPDIVSDHSANSPDIAHRRL